MAVVIAITALALSFEHFRGVKEKPRLVTFTIPPPEKAEFLDQYSIPAPSPDGHRLAYVASTERQELLWIRELDSLTARSVPGTAGAHYPFWSADSRSIAFFAEGKLKRIDLAGGPALTLCDAVMARGG